MPISFNIPVDLREFVDSPKAGVLNFRVVAVSPVGTRFEARQRKKVVGRFTVADHLLIPFACKKWHIDEIKVVWVSANGTQIESTRPCAYIDRNAQQPLRLRDLPRVWPLDLSSYHDTDPNKVLATLEALIRDNGHLVTDSERAFLSCYFGMIPRSRNYYHYDALLPLPQAHIYAYDPFTDQSTIEPESMFMLDFAFWTGREFVGVEIDGSSHWTEESNFKRHVKKDGLLRDVGVDLYHIVNSDLDEFGGAAVDLKLPLSVLWPYPKKHGPQLPPEEQMAREPDVKEIIERARRGEYKHAFEPPQCPPLSSLA